MGDESGSGENAPRAWWPVWALGMGALFGLLASGVILLTISRPRGEPVRLSTPPPPGNIRVHVTGAVAHPGIIELPYQSRVGDAIEAAGGFSQGADRDGLNLAAILEDGAQLRVPEVGATLPPQNPYSENSAARININSATAAELETLPGIGPVTAGKIIAYREANGPFARIEDIQDVPGIGPKTFDAIRDLIAVSP